MTTSFQSDSDPNYTGANTDRLLLSCPVAVSGTGKVVYENADADSNSLVMLISEEDTGHIYALSMKMKDYVSYLDKKITCSGTFNGNNKIPYCNPNSLSVGYALFPNISIDKIQD